MITFTPEQQATVDYILEQVELGSEGKNVVVSGQGGVGKTEMVCELVCILLLKGKRVAVGAMTGKATAVLREKINKKIFEKQLSDKFEKTNLRIDTIQKLTKESKVVGISDDGTTKYSNTWKDPETFNYDVLIIDELSMVPQYVSIWWQKTKCRVVGLGDFCQLPEVTTGETKMEIANFRRDLHLPDQKFVCGYGIKVLKDLSNCHLTKVLRSTNEIALLCNDLRDFTIPKAQAVNIMKEWAAKSDSIQYSTNFADLKTSLDWQIICYTNKKCQEINNMLCKGGNYPAPDDKILLFDNLNPIGKYNGEVMLFADLIHAVARKRLQNPNFYVCFKWQGQMPKKNSPYGIERQSFANYVAFKETAKLLHYERVNGIEDIIRKAGYPEPQMKEFLQQANDIRETYRDDLGLAFAKIVEYFEDIEPPLAKQIVNYSKPLPQLYMISLDYGYAVTTHKSQGSEYPKVCYILERFDRPLLYTGLSRAKEELMIINLTKEG